MRQSPIQNWKATRSFLSAGDPASLRSPEESSACDPLVQHLATCRPGPAAQPRFPTKAGARRYSISCVILSPQTKDLGPALLLRAPHIPALAFLRSRSPKKKTHSLCAGSGSDASEESVRVIRPGFAAPPRHRIRSSKQLEHPPARCLPYAPRRQSHRAWLRSVRRQPHPHQATSATSSPPTE